MRHLQETSWGDNSLQEVEGCVVLENAKQFEVLYDLRISKDLKDIKL